MSRSDVRTVHADRRSLSRHQVRGVRDGIGDRALTLAAALACTAAHRCHSRVFAVAHWPARGGRRIASTLQGHHTGHARTIADHFDHPAVFPGTHTIDVSWTTCARATTWNPRGENLVTVRGQGG